MKQDEFLVKLEERLKENRRIAESSWLPKFMTPLTSYLAFNTFRVLFVLSLGLTIFMTITRFEMMMEAGKKILFFL